MLLQIVMVVVGVLALAALWSIGRRLGSKTKLEDLFPFLKNPKQSATDERVTERVTELERRVTELEAREASEMRLMDRKLADILDDGDDEDKVKIGQLPE